MDKVIILSTLLVLSFQLLTIVPSIRVLISTFKRLKYNEKFKRIYCLHNIIKASVSKIIISVILLTSITVKNDIFCLEISTFKQIIYLIFDIYFLYEIMSFCYKNIYKSYSKIPRVSHIVGHLYMLTLLIYLPFVYISNGVPNNMTIKTTSVVEFIENFFTSTGFTDLDFIIFMSYIIMAVLTIFINYFYTIDIHADAMNKHFLHIAMMMPVITILSVLQRTIIGLSGIFLTGHLLFAIVLYISRILFESHILRYINKRLVLGGFEDE